jgi:phosphoribosylglycinamide formyltransferase 1
MSQTVPEHDRLTACNDPDAQPEDFFPGQREPLKIAVLLSGGGRTMVNLAQLIARKSLAVQITLVVSSSIKAGGVERARNLSLPVHVISRKDHASSQAVSEAVFSLVRQSGAELVVLAGYLSLLHIPDDFAGRVLNIHPALLPSFGGPGMFGHHVHEAVLEHGCKVTGCTVHFCDQSYDTGQIVLQRTCAVHERDTPDTLAARVFEQELFAYPHALSLIASGRVVLDGRRAKLLGPVRDRVARAQSLAKLLAPTMTERAEGHALAQAAIVAEAVRSAGVTDEATVAAAWLANIGTASSPWRRWQLGRAMGDDVVSLIEKLASLSPLIDDAKAPTTDVLTQRVRELLN